MLLLGCFCCKHQPPRDASISFAQQKMDCAGHKPSIYPMLWGQCTLAVLTHSATHTQLAIFLFTHVCSSAPADHIAPFFSVFFFFLLFFLLCVCVSFRSFHQVRLLHLFLLFGTKQWGMKFPSSKCWSSANIWELAGKSIWRKGL